MYDLQDHEEKHRDIKGYYECDICEDKYKSESHARLHAYCHNPVEVLEEIKNFEINLFQQMMEISPDIIAQSRNEFELKKETAAKKALDIKKEQEESKKAEKEALKIKEKEESVKKAKEEALEKEKEALEIKKQEELSKKAAEKAEELKRTREQEELRKKAEEETLEKKRKHEELIKKKKEALEIKKQE